MSDITTPTPAGKDSDAAMEPVLDNTATTAQETAPAPGEEVTDTPDATESTQPEETAQDAQPQDGEAGAAEPKEEGKPEGAKKRGGIFTDVMLVLILLAVIAFGSVYVHDQMVKYRIPTPMEEAMKENASLLEQIQTLTPRYLEAQNELKLYGMYQDVKDKVNERQNELAAENRKYSETVSNMERVQRRILALQHQIRSVDASNRQIAYSMLPGMNIGDVTTTTGKAYRNATIKHLDKKLIVISTPEGMSRFPVKQLVKDNLPPLALYAFGQLDLVDMSDFDTADTAAPRASSKSRSKTAPAGKTQRSTVYTPKSSGPVVDTRTDDPSVPTGASDEAESQDDGLVP